jgi:hypothetical protein
MQETACDEVDYFALQGEDERKRIRRLAVERYLSQGPDWFHSFLEWVVAKAESDEKAAKSFVRDLIASRMATIWKNQSADAKRKWKKQQTSSMDSPAKRQRTEDSVSKEKCPVCGGEFGKCDGRCETEKPQNVLLCQSDYSNSRWWMTMTPQTTSVYSLHELNCSNNN